MFGLFQQYDGTQFPDHDPNGNLADNDFVDSSPDGFSTHIIDYYSYANESSFLLGEWYWNGGAKKSQLSFQNLIKIIGHPNFRPEDITGQNWHTIDAQLSGDR